MTYCGFECLSHRFMNLVVPEAPEGPLKKNKK
jgi:hypothetical protein